MRPPASRRRRQQNRRGDAGGEGGNSNERWLLTYADMITLLLALFVVLFSISAVNVSKFKTLKQTLEQAFSPHILSGGGSIIPNGGSEATSHKAAAAIAALATQRSQATTLHAEEEQFRRLKEKLDAYAREHGFSAAIETTITRRGLVIRLLTDHVLFASGSAALKPEAAPLLSEITPCKRRPQPPDLGRGQHRRRADLDLTISQQLGAFRGPRDRRRPVHDRPGSGGGPARSERRRGRAPDRPEHDRRRAQPQPPGRNRPAARQAARRKCAAVKGRKKLILIAIGALLVAGLAYKMVLAPKSESKVKVDGTVYVMPKEFLLNLAGGRYAKVTVALVLAPGQSTGGEGAAAPAEASARSNRNRWCARSSPTT